MTCLLSCHCTQLSSFAALKKCVKQIDIQKFDRLLCIGKKVDLLPRHPAHAEYRRCLLKREESSGSSSLDYYGISETEGSSLLGDEPSSEITKSCNAWNGALNITLNTLKHVHLMLILTNVRP